MADCVCDKPLIRCDAFGCRCAICGGYERVSISPDLQKAIDDTRADIRAAARLSQAGAGGVVVKPIDWRDMTYQGVEEWIGHCALSQSFTIKDEGEDRLPYRFTVRPFLSGVTSFSTVTEAKAAAQADYEARILAALAASPSAVEPVALKGDVKEIVDRLRAVTGSTRRLCLDAAMMVEYLATPPATPVQPTASVEGVAVEAAQNIVRDGGAT